MIIKDLPLLADDWRYLMKLTVRVPNGVVCKLLWRYKQDWSQAHDSEPAEQKKENAGRFYANTRIRKNVRHYMETGEKPDFEIPRLCVNCDHMHDGTCHKYNQAVPDEYQRKENDCEHFTSEIPF